MGNAAVVKNVFDWTDEADDEIEIGRGRGKETGGDAPRQRARRQVLAGGGSR
jgi:hypothetical protein